MTSSGSKPSLRNPAKPRSDPLAAPPRRCVGPSGIRRRSIRSRWLDTTSASLLSAALAAVTIATRADVGVRLDDRGEVRRRARSSSSRARGRRESRSISGTLLGDLPIAVERQVGQRDDHVALPFQLGDRRAGRFHRRRVADPRLLVGVDGEPDAIRRRTVPVDVFIATTADFGRCWERARRWRRSRSTTPGGTSIPRAARAERGLGDVELVVAERRPVEAEQVQHGDHLPPREPLAVDLRGAEGRRRHVIAAQRRDQRRARAPSARARNRATRASPPAFPPSTGVIS